MARTKNRPGDDGSQARRHYVKAHGPIPAGHEVHHRNGDWTDHRPENLEALTPQDHRRTHSPLYRRAADGSWERLCRFCNLWKPVTREHYYFSKQGWVNFGRCKLCYRAAQKQRYDRDPEAARERVRRYRERSSNAKASAAA